MGVFRYLCMAAIGMALGACAFGDRDVLLTYPPEKDNEGAISAMAAEVEPGAGIQQRRPIVIALFEDLRNDKGTVGEVRNGWGMKTADANTSSDVPGWIRDAARYEFERAGYDVTFADEAADSAPTLKGQILTVYCTALLGYEAEVSLMARLDSGDEKLIDQRYTGKGSVGMNWAATGKSYGRSLTLALQDALSDLVADVSQALRLASADGEIS